MNEIRLVEKPNGLSTTPPEHHSLPSPLRPAWWLRREGTQTAGGVGDDGAAEGEGALQHAGEALDRVGRLVGSLPPTMFPPTKRVGVGGLSSDVIRKKGRLVWEIKREVQV